MPTRRPDTSPKAAVSVSEMAAMCQLSRSRMYELIVSGIMPPPVHDIRTRRPFFTNELQAECLEVRATNIGRNGRFILFYQRRTSSTMSPIESRPRPRRTATESNIAPPNDLLETLRGLGLSDVTEATVRTALAHCFPTGTAGADESDIIRSVFRQLRDPNGA